MVFKSKDFTICLSGCLLLGADTQSADDRRIRLHGVALSLVNKLYAGKVYVINAGNTNKRQASITKIPVNCTLKSTV